MKLVKFSNKDKMYSTELLQYISLFYKQDIYDYDKNKLVYMVSMEIKKIYDFNIVIDRLITNIIDLEKEFTQTMLMATCRHLIAYELIYNEEMRDLENFLKERDKELEFADKNKEYYKYAMMYGFDNYSIDYPRKPKLYYNGHIRNFKECREEVILVIKDIVEYFNKIPKNFLNQMWDLYVDFETGKKDIKDIKCAERILNVCYRK